MDDEALQLLIDEGIVEDQIPMEQTVIDVLPSLPPTVVRPIRTYTPKVRVNSNGREYKYGGAIKDYLENGGFIAQNFLFQGQ